MNTSMLNISQDLNKMGGGGGAFGIQSNIQNQYLMPKQILMPLNDIVFKNLLTSILCLIILYKMAHNLKEYFFLIWQK